MPRCSSADVSCQLLKYHLLKGSERTYSGSDVRGTLEVSPNPHLSSLSRWTTGQSDSRTTGAELLDSWITGHTEKKEQEPIMEQNQQTEENGSENGPMEELEVITDERAVFNRLILGISPSKSPLEAILSTRRLLKETAPASNQETVSIEVKDTETVPDVYQALTDGSTQLYTAEALRFGVLDFITAHTELMQSVETTPLSDAAKHWSGVIERNRQETAEDQPRIIDSPISVYLRLRNSELSYEDRGELISEVHTVLRKASEHWNSPEETARAEAEIGQLSTDDELTPDDFDEAPAVWTHLIYGTTQGVQIEALIEGGLDWLVSYSSSLICRIT